MSHSTYGKHLIYDMYGVDSDLLDDIEALEKILREGVERCGATILSSTRHHFQPNGCTVLLLLSESHASIHTYPEDGYISADIYSCGKSDPQIAIDYLLQHLKPTRVNSSSIIRGVLL